MPKNEMSDLIREVFFASELSIKKLAERSGTPYAAAHGVIRGTSDPALSTAVKLCRELGLELRPVQRRGRKG